MGKADEVLERKLITVPFLKWAGGKRWLITSHPELFPQNYNRYLEPFLGSGAVYFYMQPKSAVLGDTNSALIDTYTAIKDDWEPIAKALTSYDRRHNREFYYEVRDRTFRSPSKKAAQFIYLNRTCWNGLYRVNLKGKFNVPVGTKERVILASDNFKGVSNSLQNTELHTVDFHKIVDSAERNDFLFIDPPYTVKHNLNGFVKYNDKLFSWDDQVRLRDCVDNAVARGVKVLLTNADHESVRELYKGMGEMLSLNRPSVIAGKANGRGTFSELVVKFYKA